MAGMGWGGMSRPSRTRKVWAGLVIVLVTITLAACGGEPTPPRLVHFSPVVLLVPTDETVAIRVVYEGNDFELTSFAWMAEAGDIKGDGGAEIVYAAPSEPGNYQISVTAAYGEGEEAGELSLTTSVKVVPGASHLAVERTNQPRKPPQIAASEQTELKGAPVALAADAGQPPGGGADAAAETPQSTDPDHAEPGTEEPAPDGGSAAPAPVAGIAAADGSRLDRILADEQLIAAVQMALRPFSFEDSDGERVGFEVDLVREFARRWLNDPDAVELMPVPTAQRIPKLLAGEADIVAAALTKTPERAEQVDFSLTYFQDGQRLLVAEGSGIAGVCDLAGQQVAAIGGSTSLENLKREASACGFEPDETIVAFEHHMDAVEALLDGKVAAFTGDGVALEGFAADRPLEVVGNHFSEEPYGVAVPKGDRRLLDLVNATLAKMAADGTFAAIYAKWFGEDLAPYPLDEIDLATNPRELESLVTSDAPPLFDLKTVEPDDGAAGTVQKYVVQAGDTLSEIAGKLHGDVSPVSWQRIYEANQELIGDDPSRIEAGMTLVIPE